MATIDVYVRKEDSLFLFDPATPKASAWLKTHTDPDASMWFGPQLVVEHRYAYELAQVMLADGLTLQ